MHAKSVLGIENNHFWLDKQFSKAGVREMNTQAMGARRKNEARRVMPPRSQSATPEPAPSEARDPATDVARYIADMTAQMAAMASAARLDLIAHFLNMAHAESETIARAAVRRDKV